MPPLEPPGPPRKHLSAIDRVGQPPAPPRLGRATSRRGGGRLRGPGVVRRQEPLHFGHPLGWGLRWRWGTVSGTAMQDRLCICISNRRRASIHPCCCSPSNLNTRRARKYALANSCNQTGSGPISRRVSECAQSTSSLASHQRARCRRGGMRGGSRRVTRSRRIIITAARPQGAKGVGVGRRTS